MCDTQPDYMYILMGLALSLMGLSMAYLCFRAIYRLYYGPIYADSLTTTPTVLVTPPVPSTSPFPT